MIHLDQASQNESQSLGGIMNKSTVAGYMTLPKNKANQEAHNDDLGRRRN